MGALLYPLLRMNRYIRKGAVEVAFITFLFYCNLLMGEFERSAAGQKRGLWWAIKDVLTPINFAIAIASALMAYVFFEFLRKKI